MVNVSNALKKPQKIELWKAFNHLVPFFIKYVRLCQLSFDPFDTFFQFVVYFLVYVVQFK